MGDHRERKQEAYRYFLVSKNYIDAGDYTAALTFAQRSFYTYVTFEADRLVRELQAFIDQESHLDDHCFTTRQHDTHDTHDPAQLQAIQDLLSYSDDYYKVLSVDTMFTSDDLKRAYRKLALRFHPDKNRAPGAEDAFKLVSKAFDTLSDATKRVMYDLDRQSVVKAPERKIPGSDISSSDVYNALFGAPKPRKFTFSFGEPLGNNGDQYATRSKGPQQYSFTKSAFARQSAPPESNDHATWGSPHPPHKSWSVHQHRWDLFKGYLRLMTLVVIVLAVLVKMFRSPRPAFSFQRTAAFPSIRTTHDHDVSYYVNPHAFQSTVRNTRKLIRVEKQIEHAWLQVLLDACPGVQQFASADTMDDVAARVLGYLRNDALYAQGPRIPKDSCIELRKFGFPVDGLHDYSW